MEHKTIEHPDAERFTACLSIMIEGALYLKR